ncbi:hypothetical protein IJG14_05515 [bacterium]|nr:hypothetical protein [bacterium]
MKKIILFTIIFLISLNGLKTKAVTFDTYYPPQDERPKESIILKAGTFLKVMNLRDINTFTGDIGDECEFVNVTDMFIGEFLIIPKSSHIYGTIEDIREPVQGNNAAIKIKIEKIVTPDEDKTYYVNGYIEGDSNFYIGGEQTAPAYYKTTAHYTEGWGGGILQMTPLNIYEFGKHTQIKAGQEVRVILVNDLKIN